MKKTIYIFRFTLILFVIGLTSCDDWFDLQPQSETIFEDYWKDESDVLSVVSSCYRGMNEPAFIDRLIAWGELRSDNVVAGSSSSGDMANILNLMLNASNEYTSWSDFYKVINYCNNVIYYAPGVREKDPNFTEGQLRAYIAEVKGIRALCYFTLVRTFRDIPFITDPTADDTRSFEVPQSKPEEIIDFLIRDLISVENQSLTGYYDISHDKGRITQKAIRALIADMYLWRNDYDNCIKYCDKILNDQAVKLELEPSLVYNRNVFLVGNSTESIFELQFYDNIVRNSVVPSTYSKFPGNGGGNKLSAYDFINKTTLFEKGEFDLRGKDGLSPLDGSLFPIMKYVATRNSTSTTVSTSDYHAWIPTTNWIFYRLSDIYLMKAEAAVEKGDLITAFELVSKTYDRANPDLGSGSLDFSKYSDQKAMRDLVFDERQREFMFEGKRYFDLLRRINREGKTSNIVNVYLLRKYINLDQATVQSKINDMDALYMPINSNELKLNSLLKQNPFYVTSEDISKK